MIKSIFFAQRTPACQRNIKNTSGYEKKDHYQNMTQDANLSFTCDHYINIILFIE